MAISEILANIDRDIARLQQARSLLSGDADAVKKKAGNSRKKIAPKKASVTPSASKTAKKKKRNLSPEGRKRIVEAVRNRWAAQKAAEAK
ncbi:MAG: hypothetical protein ACP5FH_00265 [Terracidiphilus sp.]